MRKKAMTIDLAIKTLKLKVGANSDEIKKAYREQARINHPDVAGGSEDKMKAINEAFEVLSAVELAPTTMKADREKALEETREIAEGVAESMKRSINEEAFKSYLQELIGKALSSTVEVRVKKGYYTYDVTLMARFESADKETIFEVTSWCDVGASITKSQSLGENVDGKTSVPVSLGISFLHDKKKVKPYQQNYIFSIGSNALLDPTKVFPKEKMEKALATSQKRKISKRDFVLILTEKYGAKFDGTFFRIPIGENYELVIFRSVIMRLGAYSFNGIYTIKPSKRVVDRPLGTVAESEDGLSRLESVIHNLASLPDGEMLEAAPQILREIRID